MIMQILVKQRMRSVIVEMLMLTLKIIVKK